MIRLTVGNRARGGPLALGVCDLWGLTRRRVIDFGRMTADR
jgi:hypothetical protein